MHIIIQKSKDEAAQYFFGWDENGKPVFSRQIVYAKRYSTKEEAQRDMKWIPYMSRENKHTSLKIIQT